MKPLMKQWAAVRKPQDRIEGQYCSPQDVLADALKLLPESAEKGVLIARSEAFLEKHNYSLDSMKLEKRLCTEEERKWLA
jgi:hypothetical protein